MAFVTPVMVQVHWLDQIEKEVELKYFMQICKSRSISGNLGHRIWLSRWTNFPIPTNAPWQACMVLEHSLKMKWL